MPGTAKILRSNLGSACFFFQTRTILFQTKFSASYVSTYVVGLLVTSRIVFFLLRNFFYCFSQCLMYSYNFYFYFFHFVLPSLFFLFR